MNRTDGQLSLDIEEPLGDTFSINGTTLYHADVESLYPIWPTPVVIVSDGAYGLSKFEGDPHTHHEIADWYEPHVRAWTARATPLTTLWFWNSEIGWASVHPLLTQYGWRYVNCHIWDKGIAHAAGNTNTKTLRKFPVVTEVCVQYVLEAKVQGQTLKDWLRAEWLRTGLPLALTNAACGVKNAATRKYFTRDHLWYFPPADLFGRLVEYANEHGRPAGRPYFSLDGVGPATAAEWERMRSRFYCKLGVTNVWREPPLSGEERFKAGPRSVHINQKPLSLMELVISASSDPGDQVWEPFGGLCSAAIAAYRLGRKCVSAERQDEFYKLAVRRLSSAKCPDPAPARNELETLPGLDDHQGATG